MQTPAKSDAHGLYIHVTTLSCPYTVQEWFKNVTLTEAKGI